MRYYLPCLLALGLCCGSAPTASAQDLERAHLPGPLGRFWGIGYSAGYHAHPPSGSRLRHRLPGVVAPPYAPGLCLENISELTSGSQVLSSELQPTPVPSEPQGEVSASPAAPTPRTLIQQPRRDAASPSDRSGFIRRLPNVKLRDASQVSDLPPPPSVPRKASVARSPLVVRDAR